MHVEIKYDASIRYHGSVEGIIIIIYLAPELFFFFLEDTTNPALLLLAAKAAATAAAFLVLSAAVTVVDTTGGFPVSLYLMKSVAKLETNGDDPKYSVKYSRISAADCNDIQNCINVMSSEPLIRFTWTAHHSDISLLISLPPKLLFSLWLLVLVAAAAVAADLLTAVALVAVGLIVDASPSWATATNQIEVETIITD